MSIAQVQTLEDIPSAPPGDLNAITLNLTSGLISWTPPPPQHRNGILLQYSIKIETNKEHKIKTSFTNNFVLICT
jgi:roundabout, axon guidance receptor 2